MTLGYARSNMVLGLKGQRYPIRAFSHYCPQHNSKTNDPIGIGNGLGISYK